MKKILVLGAYGFLGPALSSSLEAAGHAVFRQGRNAAAQLSFDPLDVTAFESVFKQHHPEVVINLIAMTDVDRCERDPSMAFEANVRVVESIARVIAPKSERRHAHLIQISTDQVYDGPGPHREEDAKPPNVYAVTKYAGELVAGGIGATVLRTNFVGRNRSSGRKSLSDWIVGSLRSAQSITVFEDVLFSPLHISTLCRCIERAAIQMHPGLFNLGAKSAISKAAFAGELAHQLGLDSALLTAGKSGDAHLIARRPLDMTMAVDKFEHRFGLHLPTIQHEVELVSAEYAADLC